jgi:site-specific DNA recombinase
MSESNRVHVYCRVSTVSQEDGYSLDTQEAACRAWAAERTLPVASVAREVWSGGDRHRPELDALLGRLSAGDTLLCYALDRLSRSQVDTAILVDHIESAGASLSLVTEDFEKSATGTFLRGAKAFAAELEREKIAERTQRGRRARVANGKPIPGSKPPYGLVWADTEKTHLVHDADTAPVVRHIFDLALSGMTLRGIITRLHEQGILSPMGHERWSLAALRGLLLRHVYCGDAMAYSKRAIKRPDGSYTQRSGTADELVLLPNVAEAIVTREELGAVRVRLTTNKARAARNNRDPEGTLLRAGFAVCAHCGCALAVSHRSKEGPNAGSARYYCVERTKYVHGCPQPTIAASLVDGPVWARVSDVLRDPGIIAREVARHRSEGGLDRDLDAIEKQRATIANKQARTARAIATVDDDDAAVPLIVELKSLAARKNALDAEWEAVQRRMADERADAEMVTSLTAWCARVNANLDTLTYEEKRLALEALGVKVHIFRQGTLNSEGIPNPRWTLTLNLVSRGEPIVYPSTRRG